MGDDDGADAARRPQVVEQVHDLRLGRDVERGGGLVAEHDLRPAGQRDGDDDALLHAAGQLVRVGVEALLGGAEPDGAHEVDAPLPGLRPGEPLLPAASLSAGSPRSAGRPA